MPCAFKLNHAQRRTSGCQFAVPEAELIEFMHYGTWCPFHLPLRIEPDASEKASWDGARIEQFNEMIFAWIDKAKRANTVADLSGVVFPALIGFERYCGEANSLPSVRFVRTRFHGGAGFEGVTFGGGTSFREATFDDCAFSAAPRLAATPGSAGPSSATTPSLARPRSTAPPSSAMLRSVRTPRSARPDLSASPSSKG